jgi:hypothetical protein
MRVSLLDDRIPLSVPARWLLFGAAVIGGAVVGNVMQLDPLDWTYNGLLNLVADPTVPIASLATGIGLGFFVGLIHITSI